jgi:hypothetical protein
LRFRETGERLKRLKAQNFNVSAVLCEIIDEGLEKFEKERK